MNGAGQQLRDIHLPEPVSWWPPGPGWWLLAVLVAAAVAGGLWYARRRRRRLAVPRAARRAMARIEADFARHGDRRQLAADLSALLRRVALSRSDESAVAGLTGERWLEWLDRQAGMDAFTRGAGRVLIEAPYRAEPDYDADALIDTVHQWLKRRFQAND